MLESKIRTVIKKHIEQKYGGVCFVHHGSPYSERGVADLICCIDGKFVAVEVKQPGKKPRPDQEAWLKRYVNKGARCCVASTTQDVDNMLSGST